MRFNISTFEVQISPTNEFRIHIFAFESIYIHILTKGGTERVVDWRKHKIFCFFQLCDA